LRPQEVSLLRIREVATLTKSGFVLHEFLPLPANFTKGADAMGRRKDKKREYTPQTRLSFSVKEFTQVIKHIEALVRAGDEINPEDFYPEPKKHKGVSRVLPIINEELKEALTDHINERLIQTPNLSEGDPLFISQKNVQFTPNTLQRTVAKILRKWAGLQQASSYSGRRGVATDILHKQKKSVRVAQKILGHKSPSTTYIYDEPPPEEINRAIGELGKQKPTGEKIS
jgi:hypothetical protein